MSRSDQDTGLVRLSDIDITFEDPAQDIRGRDVYDREGDRVGTVEDLYFDRREGEVRFLTIASGGFLGTSIGETYRMLPVEAVTEVSEDRVAISLDRQKVTDSPAFETGVEPTTDEQRDVYEHYAHEYSAETGPEEVDEVRVRRTEEELKAGTREREAGWIDVRKKVRTDRESVEVPKRREEVKVDRVPVEGEASEVEIGDEEVSIPITEEEVVVEKRPVAREEVRIRKDVVEDTEVVEEDVRREEIDIEDDTQQQRRGG